MPAGLAATSIENIGRPGISTLFLVTLQGMGMRVTISLNVASASSRLTENRRLEQIVELDAPTAGNGQVVNIVGQYKLASTQQCPPRRGVGKFMPAPR